MKDYGTVVAMPQGHSWAPHLLSGLRVNVGTVLWIPPWQRLGTLGGKARCRLTSWGQDGGLVVVGGRESRPHGEGVQRVRSKHALPGGRW